MKPSLYARAALCGAALTLVACVAAPTFAAPKADAGMQKVLDKYKAYKPVPLTKLTPANARNQAPIQRAYLEVLDQSGADIFPKTQISHATVPGPGGKGQTLVRFFKPGDYDGKTPLPMVVYFHGGGFVIANLDVYAPSCRAIANKANCIVASVAYPLAPEKPFPAAPEASYAALQYLTKNAASFGGNSRKVAVMGESAGGNLATTVCMMAKDRNGLMPIHQVLVYPYVLNSRKLPDSVLFNNYPSYSTASDAIPLGKGAGQWFWKYYAAPTTAKDPIRYQEPIKATRQQLRALPPATVITDEIDVLHSEGNDYANKLKAAGVPVRYRYFTGVTHEFFGMSKVVPQADQAQAFVADGLKQAFGTS